MSFEDLKIKDEYRSLNDNVLKEFYYPILNEAVTYDRAVGFFSSTALSAIAEGVIPFVKNGGKIRLIASPKLSEEDMEAISKGYKLRDEVIKSVVLRELYDIKDKKTSNRLNLLANLIADEKLDIKIAFTSQKGMLGMYHEKLGIFKDLGNNAIAFSGSMNESVTALSINYESIDVYCSWKSEENKNRVERKIDAFESIWNDLDPSIKTIYFPEIKEEILKKYKRDIKSYDEFDEEDFIGEEDLVIEKVTTKNIPKIPEGFKFHDYQEQAIGEWEKHNYVGIFDMATGTGKTYTALGAIERVSRTYDNRLGVVIVCPYKHLVEQWAEDVIKFNIEPIIAYSASSQKDWKRKLDSSVRDQKLGVKNKNFFCLLTTNATYSGDYVQKQIEKMKGNLLIVIDEAHNFGATSLKNKLHDKFQFRLALSATLDRHNDEEGTKALYDYFGEKCIEYSLEKAIEQGFLTKYKYYPKIICLTEDEQQLYSQYTQEIIKCIKKDKNGKSRLSEKGKIIALKRAKVVAGAANKIVQLKEDIEKYKEDNHILVYCGATQVLEEDKEYTNVDTDDIRQIDLVTHVLGNELNMKVSQFTSKESMDERAILKDEFSKGESLQALIAIKCLVDDCRIKK